MSGNISISGSEKEYVVKNLIEFAYDKDQNARQCIESSISSWGINEPVIVLSLIIQFLKKNFKNKKIHLGHRVLLLNASSKIILEVCPNLKSSPGLVVELISQLTDEMMSQKDIDSEISQSASNVLVGLSSFHTDEVMRILSQNLSPSVQPHNYILLTIGNMAAHNPKNMQPYLTGLVTQLLTFVSTIKGDTGKWVFSHVLAQFCDAVMETKSLGTVSDTNRDVGIMPYTRTMSSTGDESFSAYIHSIFKIFYTSWLNNKDTKVRSSVIHAIGSMTPLMDRITFESQLSPVLNTLVNLYKRHHEAYHLTAALASVLQVAAEGLGPEPVTRSHTSQESSVAIESLVLHSELEKIMTCLYNQLLVPASDPSQQALLLKNHNEIKRCFAILCDPCTNKVLTFLMTRLETNVEKNKITSLILVRHLVSCCKPSLLPHRSLIVTRLRNLINTVEDSGTASNNLLFQIAQTVIAMAYQGYLNLEGGHDLLQFLVAMCSINIETEESVSNKSTGPLPDDLSQVMSAQLVSLCENFLLLAGQSIEEMKTILWPHLLEFVLPEIYTNAVATLCDSLNRLMLTQGQYHSGQIDSSMESNEYEELDNHWYINFDEMVNVPKPQYLVARFIVLAGNPKRGKCRGIPVLQTMIKLSINFHENLHDLWSMVLPQLIKYIEGSENIKEGSSKFNQSHWEDLMLKMLSKSIEQVCDEEWVLKLGEAFSHQISLYNKYPEEKGFLYRCLGTIMSNTNHVAFLTTTLNLISSSVRHQNETERLGVALCFGSVGTRHLELVLTKLEELNDADNKTEKKAAGLLGLLKDRDTLIDCQLVRATILLSFGHVMFMADPGQVPFRLETHVMPLLLKFSKKVKETWKHQKMEVKEALIQSYELICRAVHPSHLGSVYNFKLKSGILEQLLSFIKAEPTDEIYSEIRMLVFRALIHLIRLTPPFCEKELKDLILTCTDAIYALPQDGISQKKLKELSLSEIGHQQKLTEQTIEWLNALHVELLKQFFTDGYMSEIFKHLLGRIQSIQDHERLRALKSFLILLKAFHEFITDPTKFGHNFSSLGSILGHMVPRIVDPVLDIRSTSLECVHFALNIDWVIQKGAPNILSSNFPPSHLASLKDRLCRSVGPVSHSTLQEICVLIVRQTPYHLLPDFLAALYIGLTDSQSQSVAAICCTLDALFTHKHADIEDKVDGILCTLHDELGAMALGSGRAALLRCVRTLGQVQLIQCLNAITSQSLPLDGVWSEMLVAIFSHKSSVAPALEHLVELLLRSKPYEERDPVRKEDKKLKLACHTWLAALNCLQVLCRVDAENRDIILKNYARLFVIWFTACSTTVSCYTFQGKPFEKKSGFEAKLTIGVKPSSIAIEGLRNFLMASGSHEVIEELSVVWDNIDTEADFDQACQLLAKGVCDSDSNIGLIIKQLVPCLSSPYKSQKIAACAFLSALLQFKRPESLPDTNKEEVHNFVDLVISRLLNCVKDADLELRVCAVQGLGNVGFYEDSIVQRRSLTLLTALTENLNCSNDPHKLLCQAVIEALILIIPHLKAVHLSNFLSPICHEVVSISCERSAQLTASLQLRMSAFTLLTACSQFATGDSGELRTSYLLHMDNFLVPMILHAHSPKIANSDNNVSVDSTDQSKCRTVCVRSLINILPVLFPVCDLPVHSNGEDKPEDHLYENDSDQVTNSSIHVIIKRWLSEKEIVHFTDFLSDLSRLMVNKIPERCPNYLNKCVYYFRSDSTIVQANAVTFAGLLMANFDEQLQSKVQKDYICMELIHLLHSENALVRIKTAESLGLLHMY